ncbi:MAG: ATPase [Candidatus Omnitrophica bacterium CG12_big_fil_rev_8_21_14_0_65_50_5]|nr:MAG: ATPase [Candidatus Omnitrophica bacterium CG12_big_fil_rev_8_21_14_0_65_50_5]
MYLEFFGFKENPFNITADPEFFFSSKKHTEAFSHLLYGIKERKGIMVVTGEIGTGKTTLCRMLLNKMGENIQSALILNPSFSALQLLQLIISDFGIDVKSPNKFDLMMALNQFLIQQTNSGRNVVLIIDECQNLGVSQLEQIRLLSNLETEKQKLLQIILFGQPELMDKLGLKSLRQLNQRIAVRYHVMPLERDEVDQYIRHRLDVARSDYSRPPVIFSESAINQIYVNSKGTPRMINIFCDRALLAGFACETFTITEDILHRCVQEVAIH